MCSEGETEPPWVGWSGLEGEDGAVLVYRLAAELTQSRVCGRTQPSNACTIIAVKMAEAFFAHRLSFHGLSPPKTSPSPPRPAEDRGKKAPKGHEDLCPGPGALTGALVNAMLDGNALHEWTMALHRERDAKAHFTIPAAIGVCKEPLRELDYQTVRGMFGEEVERALGRAVGWWGGELGRREPLCLLLIAYQRTVFLAYQPVEEMVGLVDSHSHPPHGALIGLAHSTNLRPFARWIARSVFPESQNTFGLGEFEISVLLPSQILFGSDGEAGRDRRASGGSSPSVLRRPAVPSTKSPSSQDSPPRPERPPLRRGIVFPEPLPQPIARTLLPSPPPTPAGRLRSQPSEPQTPPGRRAQSSFASPPPGTQGSQGPSGFRTPVHFVHRASSQAGPSFRSSFAGGPRTPAPHSSQTSTSGGRVVFSRARRNLNAALNPHHHSHH